MWYKVKTKDGLLLQRNADQIKITCAEPGCESVTSTRSDMFTTDAQPSPQSESVAADLNQPKTLNLESESVKLGITKPVHDCNPSLSQNY